MDKLLGKLREHVSLSKEEAFSYLQYLLEVDVADSQIAEFLTALKGKGVVVAELQGFADYLASVSQPCALETANLFDVCGTGGDGKNTINISTLTAFTLAAMGEKVAKHGNYSASSTVGSSNLLEALGVPLADNFDKAKSIFSEVGIVFLHAPLWHPKLKRVAPIRKALGFRTVFNLLGPLLNPAKPDFQLIGTPSQEVATLLFEVQKQRKVNKNFSIVCDENGYDEVSLTTKANILSEKEAFSIEACDFGVSATTPESLVLPRTLQETVEMATQFLSGHPQEAHLAVVAANTATALRLRYCSDSFASLFDKAKTTICSGEGMRILEQMRGMA